MKTYVYTEKYMQMLITAIFRIAQLETTPKPFKLVHGSNGRTSYDGTILRNKQVQTTDTHNDMDCAQRKKATYCMILYMFYSGEKNFRESELSGKVAKD